MDRFDVGIIGGGPAGSGAASYLAKAGLRCVVLERERFPRPHVGESLVPSTTRVFRELGFLEQMEKHRFPRKYGAAWTTAYGSAADHGWEDIQADCQVDVRFDERRQEGVDQNYTYHVDRGKFDHLLLQHAARLGADVREEAAVSRVDLSDGDGARIDFRSKSGSRQIRVRMVVDASGRRTLLGNQLKIRIPDTVFDQYAVHTWFEGYDRGAGEKADYIWIHFLPISNSWVWQIPITDTITSFGVVTQKRNFRKARASLDAFFWSSVGNRPEIEEKLRQARQVRAFTSEGDYSYAMERIAGDRFVLVGDAARFVDPIFSSGVSIALNSARLASRDILAAMEAGDLRGSSFQTFATTMRQGCTHWYEFIRLYYRLNALFTYFVGHPRHRLDVLRLLQGDVYEAEEPAVLAKMREMVTEVERNEKHVWHRLLGDLTADAFKPAF